MAAHRPWVWPALAFSDLLWPERCALCDADPARSAWTSAGALVAGLRAWDRPHLCAGCAALVAPAARLHALPVRGGRMLPVAAARPEDALLVRLVGALKYHGVRGLAWPLAELLLAAAPLLRGPDERGLVLLVPVPLHRSRHRERGFNQAELLAGLAAARLGWGCAPRALRRRRATPQQAKLPAEGAARAGNVRGAFTAARPVERATAILVDDLVTTGHTLAAACEALSAQGWPVTGALVAGASPGLGRDARVRRGDGGPDLDSA